MSNKVTFEEFVKAISDQSGKSEQFTHDFVKDWVSAISEGLKKDGNINIAGLGKFELRKMDERDGFNPQTEEQITIPAHNKIVFKPYKDLRELVNAPYAHLEPEIIEEEDEETSSDINDSEESPDQTADAFPASSDHDRNEEDSSDKEKAPWEQDMEKEVETDDDDPFGLDAGHKSVFPLSQSDDYDSGDANNEENSVFKEEEEGNNDEEETDSPSKEVTDTSTEEDKSEVNESFTENSDELTGETTQQELDSSDAGETEVPEEATADSYSTSTSKQETREKYTPTGTPSLKDRRHRRRETGGNFWIIAAGFLIILLLIAGAWYYLGSQQTPESSSETIASTSQPNNNSTDNPANASGSEAAQNAGQSSSASQSSSNRSTSGNSQQAGNTQAANSQAKTSFKTISVVQGQTLWGLADNQYDNPYLWPWIYDTNKSSIDDPDIIVIGQSLDIPLRSGTDSRLSENDSLQVALGYVETYKWYKENNLTNARFYLYAAKKYHARVFEHTDAKIDEADLAFANRAQ